MKRYRIKNKFRFISFLTVLIVVASFTFGSALGLFDAAASEPRVYNRIKVEAGDTLWNLALEYGPENQDVRRTVYDICKLNDVSADSLAAGTYLLIPVND